MSEFTSFSRYHRHSLEILAALHDHQEPLDRAVGLCWDAIRSGRTLVWCGNGGSAAEAQHMSAELVGRFVHERSAIRSLAITTDSSALTALSNDYSFDVVFARQIEAVVRSGDVMIALSTSGKSANVLSAMNAARRLGGRTVALTGRGPNPCSLAADISIAVDDVATSHIQEAHLVLAHFLCLAIEERWVAAYGGAR